MDRSTIETSDRPCPDCGADLQVIYRSELQQVVSGWACAACGFVESTKHDYRARVPLRESRDYVLRTERPLTREDVRNPLDDILDEFRARASADLQPDEVWMLIDPEAGEIVEVHQGEQVRREREASGDRPSTDGRPRASGRESTRIGDEDTEGE